MVHNQFMREALDIAKRALHAGEFPVGCVIVCGDRVIASGSRARTTGEAVNEIDHAEMNALRHLAETGPHGNFGDIVVFTTLEPCLMCFGAIILSGIGKIVYSYEDVMGGASGLARERLTPVYKDSKIVIEGGVLRLESLNLFKAYFSDPANKYLAKSFFARHVLRQ